MDNDCLAFRFQGSLCQAKEISMSFWIRMRGGRSIIRTGLFTKFESGPGILIEYVPSSETLVVTFQSMDYYWSVKQHLFKYAWSHVSISWGETTGLKLVVDGNIKNMTAMVTGVKKEADVFGKK